MLTGQEMRVGDYTLKMAGLREGQTANYQYGQVFLEAYKDGKLLRTLKPEKRDFAWQQSTTTVGLYSTQKEDLYVVFYGMSEFKMRDQGTRESSGFWVWFGSAIMFLGTGNSRQ
jgi:cytochrome c biogenesis factor